MQRLFLFLVLIAGCSHHTQDFDSVKVAVPPTVPMVENKVSVPFVSGPTKLEKFPFENITSNLGLSQIDATHFYPIDINNDGVSDLVILPDYYSIPRVYLFDKKLKKYIFLKDNLFPEVVKGSFLVFADFNKDGIVDVIVANTLQKTELNLMPLRMFQGRFDNLKHHILFDEVKDVFPAGVSGPMSIALLDYNLDGLLDIYLANWIDVRDPHLVKLPDQLLTGTANGMKFKFSNELLSGEYLRSNGQYVHARASMSASICDMDQDGYPDILLASHSQDGNKLWMNQPYSEQRVFTDLANITEFDQDKQGAGIGNGGGSNLFIECADYNRDQIMDGFSGSTLHSYESLSKDRSVILTGSSYNFPFKFLRSEYFDDDNVNPDKSWVQNFRRGFFVDFNGDGLEDIIIENTGFASKTRLKFLEQLQDHSFDDKDALYGINVANPYGVTILDINHDQKPDFIVGTSLIRTGSAKGEVFLFENKNKSNQFYRIHLNGILSNKSGIGAMIKINSKNPKVIQRRYVHYSTGAASTQNEEGTFVADPYGIESLDVTWPIKKISDKQTTKDNILKVHYKFNSKKLREFTLCENGKILPGKAICK